MRRVGLTFAVLCSLLSVGSLASAQVLYDAYDLGPPPGYDRVYTNIWEKVIAINNAGQVVANAGNAPGEAPYIWEWDGDDHSWACSPLPLYQDDASKVYDINDAGLAVGGRTVPVYWDCGPGGTRTPTALPLPVGALQGSARGINNADPPQVVGHYYTQDAGEDPVRHDCVWTIDEEVSEPMDVAMGASWVFLISDFGEVCYRVGGVGYVWPPEDPEGEDRELYGLGGEATGTYGMNGAGDIVGTAWLPDGTRLGALWPAGQSTPTSLGPLGGALKWCYARGINQGGEIVGESFRIEKDGPMTLDSHRTATLWKDGQIINLNDVLTAPTGLQLRMGFDINDDGWILGNMLVDGHTHLFVLIPATVPNQPPVAEDDSYRVDVDGLLTVGAPGVLGNDSDPDDDPIIAVWVAGPLHGSLTGLGLGADGSFGYVPNPDWDTDSFTYTAFDGDLDSDVATVTITVGSSVEPGAITGTVYDASGKRVKNATVTAFLVDGDTLVQVKSTSTAPNGAYTLTGLEAGDYKVVAAKDPAEGFAWAAVVSGQTTTGVDILIE